LILVFRSRRLVLAAVVAVLVAATGFPTGPADPAGAATAASAAGAAPGADPPDGPAGVLPPDEQWTVTLLTGETVGVVSDADGRVRVEVRRTARTGSVRTVHEPDGDVYVLPGSADALLDGEADHELFNVTGLIRQGLDDASADGLPLIIQHLSADGVTARSVQEADGTPQELPSIDAVAITVSRSDPEAASQLLEALDAPTTSRSAGPPQVWLDRQVEASSAVTADERSAAARVSRAEPEAELDWNLRRIGADQAWAAGIVGEGARVAILDTGVDAEHPDLAGQIVAQENFSSSPDTVDRFGHGTHVAATVAGSGAGAPGMRSGVAPGADLLIGKVLGDDGFGSESDIIAGMEWAAPQADVVNMSLGSDLPSDGSDPLSQAVDNLTEQHGALFVLAAGNSGPNSQTIGSPAAAEQGLTVGAVDREDQLAEFSSRGPLVDSYELKPEIVAPGVDVVAARAADTSMGDPQDALYTSASGTSMATPHVAGAAALLVQQHPDWSAGQLEAQLVGSSHGLDADGYDVGAGRLDIGAGVSSELRPDQDVVDLRLPHPHTTPGDVTVGWTNTGDVPLTADLTAELEDRTGAPASATTVTPAQLTIEPGASGTATLTIDGAALDDGLHSGAVVATVDGEPSMRTPIGVYTEPELFDLTIEATPPPGGAADAEPGVFYVVTNLDDYALFNHLDGGSDMSPTLQVPAGRYSVIGMVFNGDGDNGVEAQVGDPDVVVDGDTTVRFDGAAAEPFEPRLRGVETAPPLFSDAALLSTPARGAGGRPVVIRSQISYPMAGLRVAPMEGDPDVFAARQIFRLQAPPWTVDIGADGSDDPVEIVPAGTRQPEAGETTLTAIDAGDGRDLSGTAGGLAVVRLPDLGQRAAVTDRAVEAGTAMLAFVDETRPHLDPAMGFEVWADLPVIAAGGESATALVAAAAAGSPVTMTATASPFVYDLAPPAAAEIDPTPVIGRDEQRRLARIDERFHRDADGTGPTYDSRSLALSDYGWVASAGPLPERRTAYVTPGVAWVSAAVGPYEGELFGNPELRVMLVGQLSMDAGTAYEAGSRQQHTYLRRPQWPGMVGSVFRDPFCPAGPPRRTVDEVLVHVVPFQDGYGRLTCADALDETLTLRRDGVVVGNADHSAATFPVESGDADLQLHYQQNGRAPYLHRSTTTWTFHSTEPEEGEALLSLLTVSYALPLDTRNRPTGDTASLTVRNIADDGSQPRRIRSLTAWTSVDRGATWQPASVTRTAATRFDVGLPDAPSGTPVSLRVDTGDHHGSRIEQTLIDAYVS
jgi:subtilisin family serine protease